MKTFFFGSWITTTIIIVVTNAESIPNGFVVWGVAAFAGWAVMTIAERNRIAP